MPSLRGKALARSGWRHRLADRQAEGLTARISLLGLTLRVPAHTTLSRRSATWQKTFGLPQRTSEVHYGPKRPTAQPTVTAINIAAMGRSFTCPEKPWV